MGPSLPRLGAVTLAGAPVAGPVAMVRGAVEVVRGKAPDLVAAARASFTLLLLVPLRRAAARSAVCVRTMQRITQHMMLSVAVVVRD